MRDTSDEVLWGQTTFQYDRSELDAAVRTAAGLLRRGQARRRPKARTPCERVPSIPARRAVGAPALPRRETPSRGPERLVFRPRLQSELPGLPGPGARGPSRAGGAVRLAEPDRDVGRAVPVDPPAPAARRLALRAADLPLVPVDLEAVGGVTALDLGLPARVRPRRAEQVDAEPLAARDQQLGVDVGGVHQVLGRREALAGQGLVNRGRAARLVHGGDRRHRVRDQVDRVVLAGFGEVHDPSAIDAIGFTMSVASAWPAIAKRRRRRPRPA